ncbi:cdc25-like protein phosphatase twine isoform X2 [Pomacea canaliculata]|uniref:cdc25-like protein phosphatase twine isoform X2 n=1 Tax=Pomacea canaliculata TaxID=400727 RepID=UPI000D72F249|nr:cdc25-like protein phosphatase twine isoform X2 [Pomacea canaliculata]
MSRRPLISVNRNPQQELGVGLGTPKTRSSMSETGQMTALSSNSLSCGLNSPMTSLAMNLSELSTGRITPKRRLSLSSIDTPCSDRMQTSSDTTSSAESGVFAESSPLCEDSPTLERKKTIAFRRLNNQPPPTLRLDTDSPTDFLSETGAQDRVNPNPLGDATTNNLPQPVFCMDDCSSQDSGVSLDKEFDFKCPAPISKCKKKVKSADHCEETCSPLKYSPVKSSVKRPLSFSVNSFNSSSDGTNPTYLPCCSLTSSKGDDAAADDDGGDDDDDDDGFLDLVDMEVSEINDQVPESFSSLFNEPVINRPHKGATENHHTPTSRKVVPSRLRRSQSVDIQVRQFKRSDSCRDESFLVQNKRWKPGQSYDDSSKLVFSQQMPGPRLHRCHSETEAMIKSAVSRMSEEPDLIGDCSKPYVLPLLKGRHQDLKAVSPETLAKLMANEFSEQVEDFDIIDCRYPYEFKGGHIKHAKNLFTRDAVMEEYLKNPRKLQDPTKRFILIFHCEFSSERGPNLFRFLRSKDRESNKECYPFLHYPEIYLLEGGYKAFFEEYRELCEPQTYKQMLHKDHSEDLRKFRAKSKSWAGEKGGNRSGLRSLKF